MKNWALGCLNHNKSMTHFLVPSYSSTLYNLFYCYTSGNKRGKSSEVSENLMKEENDVHFRNSAEWGGSVGSHICSDKCLSLYHCCRYKKGRCQFTEPQMVLPRNVELNVATR